MMMVLLAQAGQNAATGTGDDSYLFWGMALFGIALLLLLLEFIVPSGGLIAALCAIAIFGSVFSFFKYDALWGYIASALYLIFGPILIFSMFKFWLHSPMAKWMILGGIEQNENESGDTAMSPDQARRERMAELNELIGLRGVTITSLRPVGKVRIEGRRIDAMAETGVIEADTPIVVVDVYDNQIKVRPE